MNKFIKKSLSVLMIACLSFGIYYGFLFFKKNNLKKQTENEFISYDHEKYGSFIKKIFADDWYFLMADPNADVDFVFKTRSPNTREPKYFGKMDIVLLCENKQPVGVVTYYMQSQVLGRILFLVVDKDFRGKRYGEKLLRYAFDALKKKGATSVKLFVRSANKTARKLYERVGFKEADPEPYSLGLWYRKKL